MKIKDAISTIGCDLSKPSKMPGFGFSVPASACQTGAKLRKIPGTACSKCYAFRGNYGFKQVQSGLTKRLHAIDNPGWVEAMVTLITKRCATKGVDYFRWFDSGDIQSTMMLLNIFEVCRQTPHIEHWLPTQERGYLLKHMGPLPPNLCIRLSNVMMGTKPAAHRRLKVQTSTVGWNSKGFQCEAKKRGNQCGPCRACWDKTIPNVNYPKH